MDKRRVILVVLLCLLPLPARADRHKIGFRGAVPYAERSSLKGVGFSTDFPLARKEVSATGNGADHTFSAILEGSVVWGEHEGEDLTQTTYLSGLRASLNRIKEGPLDVFAQVLVGGSHDSRGEIQNQPVVAGGVGLHFHFAAPTPDRAREWGVSLQIDRYVLLSGTKEWYTNISLGIVLRIE